jgi:hypothetical protein
MTTHDNQQPNAVPQLPRNPQGRPLAKHQRFEYWAVGFDDGREGLPPLRWMKQSWPEDGRDAYYEGHKAGFFGEE